MSVWAISDLHGRLDIFRQMLDKIDENDIVYFLGDAADRGPDGVEIWKILINDPRFRCIKGNHEQMMLEAMKGLDGYSLWFYNGGRITFDKLNIDPDKKKIINTISRWPTDMTYINTNGETIYMSHSGAGEWDDVYSDDYEKIWNRRHFHYSSNFKDNEFIIHGHTPIPYLVEELNINTREENIEPGGFWYANGHKCDIDCGTVFTGCATMLNLDTFDEEVFMEEDNER